MFACFIQIKIRNHEKINKYEFIKDTNARSGFEAEVPIYYANKWAIKLRENNFCNLITKGTK